MNNKISWLHERALRIVYKNYELSFEQLLIKDSSFCFHHENIHSLMIEICKIFHNMTDVYNDFFVKNSHDFSLQSNLFPSVNSVLKGRNSLRYFGSII